MVATGSEVDIARRAKQLLEKDGVNACLVSMPCAELFADQDDAYKTQVLGDGVPIVAVEAGIRQSWDRLLGHTGGFVGMSGFGASAPTGDLYMHFEITPEAVAREALRVIGRAGD